MMRVYAFKDMILISLILIEAKCACLYFYENRTGSHHGR